MPQRSGSEFLPGYSRFGRMEPTHSSQPLKIHFSALSAPVLRLSVRFLLEPAITLRHVIPQP